MAKLRSSEVAFIVIAVAASTAAFILTYSVAMVPYDRPNLIIAPFLPGFFVYQLLHGFKEGPIPGGIGGAFIAATNALFYGISVFALYRLFGKQNFRRSPQ